MTKLRWLYFEDHFQTNIVYIYIVKWVKNEYYMDRSNTSKQEVEASVE